MDQYGSRELSTLNHILVQFLSLSLMVSFIYLLIILSRWLYIYLEPIYLVFGGYSTPYIVVLFLLVRHLQENLFFPHLKNKLSPFLLFLLLESFAE